MSLFIETEKLRVDLNITSCVSTNLYAFSPMEVHLPGEKSILPYFSSPRGVAILDCDSHSQAGSTTFKGILFRGILVLLFSFTYWQYISIWIFLQIFIQYLYWQLLETFLCLFKLHPFLANLITHKAQRCPRHHWRQ